jgi:hypothetical protein
MRRRVTGIDQQEGRQKEIDIRHRAKMKIKM